MPHAADMHEAKRRDGGWPVILFKVKNLIRGLSGTHTILDPKS